MKLDLNCDLGEGEPSSSTRGLMRWITSANVACGGHAGDARSMTLCVQLAKRFGVRLGAHPGPWSRNDFGRGQVTLSPDELELLLLHQVSALEKIARALGVRLHHVKLHGGLYHACEADAVLARAYSGIVRRWWPTCRVYARAGGLVAAAARHIGLKVWEEAFVDRAYQDDGNLVPRSEPGAVLKDTAQVIGRLALLQREGQIETISGKHLSIPAQTLCLHSDTEGACALARTLRTWQLRRRA